MQLLKVSAPGDEYFGRMKLSYLGINNTFHDDSIRAGAYTTDSRMISSVNFADEALHAWERKYPHDPQLARSYYLAFLMYEKIWTKPGQDKAWQYMHAIEQRWPTTWFGKQMKKDIAAGFTEHLFAEAVPCPATPEPTPMPSGSPNGRHATPSPSPSPTPTPTPEPTPTPAPGQPAVEILPVPCFTPSPAPTIAPVIAPPLPSPSGSPAPGRMPSGAVTPTPSGAVTPTPSGALTPTPLPSVSPSPR